jgi:hypothetical protein
MPAKTRSAKGQKAKSAKGKKAPSPKPSRAKKEAAPGKTLPVEALKKTISRPPCAQGWPSRPG